MRISCNWLADYVNVDWSPEELAERLTMSGLEMESIDKMGSDLEGVVVGQVLETSQHPNADRLTVCSVDLGEGDPVQIVCGAPNVAAGQRVPVATVGTILELPDRKNPAERVPVKLKRTKIRGEESLGMICAEDELGLSDDHSGIMVLPEDAPVGDTLTGYLAGQGTVTSDMSIDLAITPNRPDAISHLGVARDVGALADVAVCRPEIDLPNHGGEAADQISVRIDTPDGCHRYAGVVVRGVTIGESPQWMRSRLEAVGLRSVSNVVDITNYVMLECGQPLHAFDLDQVAGAAIRVHRTEAPSKFTTLDGKERDLPTGTVMIADAERDVAVAGVMGGENSEVSDSTSNVLIESAWFNPSDVRRAAKSLQLQTDASYRFERGVDPTIQLWAATRAAELMRDLAGGTIVPGAVDCHPTPWEAHSVNLRSSRIAHIMGVEVPDSDVERLLTAIGFQLESTDEGWTVGVPPFRPDVEREIDVIEEVARLYGLDQIEEPSRGMVPNERLAPPKALPPRLRLADQLKGVGFREIYTNSMMRVDRAEMFASAALRGGGEVGPVVTTLNPISQEMAALRPSLLPGALQVLAHNMNHGRDGMAMFEFGHVFDRAEGDSPIPGYREEEHLMLVLAGKEGLTGWDTSARSVDLFDLKGAVSDVLTTLGVDRIEMNPVNAGSEVTRYHLEITRKGRPVGSLGAVSPEVLSAFDLDTDVYYAELNFSAMVEAVRTAGPVQYAPVSRFPVVNRDIAVLLSRNALVLPVIDTIRRAGGKLLRDCRVFDIYQGDRIGPDQKSVAFSLAFAADRTLKDSEVDKAVSKIVKALGQDHGAELRG